MRVSAPNDRNVPPPATALIMPVSTPERNSRKPSRIVIRACPPSNSPCGVGSPPRSCNPGMAWQEPKMAQTRSTNDRFGCMCPPEPAHCLPDPSTMTVESPLPEASSEGMAIAVKTAGQRRALWLSKEQEVDSAMDIIRQIEAEQAARIEEKRKLPEFQPGDTVRVNVRVTEGSRTRVQAYEGVCIARSGSGFQENFTVRKISYGEGVERVFPVYSPLVESVEVVRRGKVRRAKLYYLRD